MLGCKEAHGPSTFFSTAFDIKKVESVFHRIRKRARLPHFRLYDLRHTYASRLLAARAPIIYVSAQLGQANPTTTLRYYAKWMRGWLPGQDSNLRPFG